jgi:diguanylate cyclase (GGDEF)-like protein
VRDRGGIALNSLNDMGLPKYIRIYVVLWMSQLILLCAGAQQYAFHEDGEQEGLNSLTVNCLVQARSGFVWVCTENGLYKFDGATYTRIGAADGLPDSDIVSMHEDALGELWIGTSNHLYHGNGKHFSVISAAPYALAGNLGQQLASTVSGQVLATSRQRLFRLTRAGVGGAWTVEPFFSQVWLDAHSMNNKINSIYVARGGSMWMGCGYAVCQVSAQNVKIWGTQEGVPNDIWAYFLEDSAGRLWARGFHHMVSLSQGGTVFANKDISFASASFGNMNVPIVEDAAHRILTRTDHGLAIWRQGRWQMLDAANGLRFPGITALLVDHEGELWLGTLGKGVQHWLGFGNWETWAAEQGLAENIVWKLVRDRRGTLWAATESGIVIFDSKQGRFVPWHPNASVPRGQVATVMDARDQSLWFSTFTGRILYYMPATGEMRHATMPVGVRQVWLDSSDQAWALTGGGIYRIDPSLKSITKVRDPAIPDQLVSDACEDGSHALWFASKSGLLRFFAGQWSKIAIPGKDEVDGFASVACAADGTLWLAGASTSLSHLRVKQATAGLVATDAEMLPPQVFDSAEVFFVRFDRRGWLWVGTGSGVYVFNGISWRHITAKDGLTWNECNEGAFLADDDGSVWIGTANGLSHLLHPEKLFEQQPLSIISADATFGEARVTTDASFPWTREPLRVHMASSAIADQRSVIYRYRFAGLERSWTASKSQDLLFSSLPDGNYRLDLYAEDTDRGVRSPLTTISFRLRPPWWRSIPFEIVWSSSLLALVYAFMRFRERQLRDRQAHLEALVRARTQELEWEKQNLEKAHEALREQNLHDGLTGLLNHGAICDVLDREMARALRDGIALTIVMIDLDHFKSVNDTYGHIAGDVVLREFAQRITGSIRIYDAAGRYGGEEFLVILPDFDAERDRSRLASIHQGICQEPVQIQNGQVKISCSFGVSVLFRDHPLAAMQFIDQADKALYKAKDAGRNCIGFHEPLQTG